MNPELTIFYALTLKGLNRQLEFSRTKLEENENIIGEDYDEAMAALNKLEEAIQSTIYN